MTRVIEKRLTPTERQTLHYSALGYTNDHIATLLGRTTKAVNRSLHLVYKKLGLTEEYNHRVAAAIAYHRRYPDAIQEFPIPHDQFVV